MRDDPETMMIYKTLIAILETGLWPNSGGIYDQEYFWIDLIATFGPLRKSLDFNEKFNIVAKSLSSGSKSQPQNNQGKVRRP